MVFRNDNIWPALKELSDWAEDGSQQRAGNTLHFDIFFFLPPLWLLVQYFMPLVSHSLLLLECQPSLQH